MHEVFNFEKDELAIGLPEIDRQHKLIVELLNEFYDKVIVDHPGVDWRNEMIQILARASKLARAHFEYEEKLLKMVGYPRYEDHCAEHQGALNKIIDFMGDINMANKKSAEELVGFLKKYVIHHMVGQDKNFVFYVQEYLKKQKTT